MKSAICTLFEGDYHFGLGALCNSLYKNGYRGVVHAGYRGSVPPWATGAALHEGYLELAIAPNFFLRLSPVTTDAHLTNYKPDFMLSLWRDHCADADALFYFDPDIVVMCRWSFFEEWVSCGVAVCADVNADMPATHPLRHAWSRFFGRHGIHVVREQNIYFNGGFVGVARQNRGFLKTWQRLQELMKPAIGGFQNTGLFDRTFLFHKTDQDTLNVATMTSEEPVSFMGRDGMDFQHGGGGYVMSHAAGSTKPWRKKMLWGVLTRVMPPNRADKAFVNHADLPIKLYSPLHLGLKRLDILLAAAAGKFISRA